MNRINEYIDRFFEGTLSEAEELKLKAFLTSPEGLASEYDEARRDGLLHRCLTARWWPRGQDRGRLC